MMCGEYDAAIPLFIEARDRAGESRTPPALARSASMLTA